MGNNEIWKPVVGYEELYEVSSMGKIKSLNNRSNHKKEKILKPIKDKDGYLRICLCKNNKKKIKAIHRLVAEAFISNPNNKPVINHKDGIKYNNNVNNLEWCTISENSKHAYDNRLRIISERQKEFCRSLHIKNMKRINQYDMEDNFIKTWNSIADIKRQLKIDNISACCKGIRKQSGNFKWRYADEQL